MTFARARLLATAVALLPAAARAQTITAQVMSTPFPGIRVTEGRTTSPATRFWAAHISLCHDYVHVTATSAPRALQSTSAWGAAAGVQLAVNGDFFRPGPPPRVFGNAVGAAGPWPLGQTGNDPDVSGEWYYRNYGWIAFGADFVEFNHTEHVKQNAARFGARQGFSPTAFTTTIPAGTRALVSGFPELVTEGRRYECSSPTASSCFPDRGDMRERHPRTAMGLTEDRRTFILVVVDGRSAVSAGMYGEELASLVHQLGAWQAFNLDGGGSTQMWLAGRGTLNDPSDGAPRAVANHWGIFAGTGGGRPRDPGSCVPVGAAAPDAGADASRGPDSRGDATTVRTDGGATADPRSASADAAASPGFGGDAQTPPASGAVRGAGGSSGLPAPGEPDTTDPVDHAREGCDCRIGGSTSGKRAARAPWILALSAVVLYRSRARRAGASTGRL